jgi:hypothetical protein
MDPVEMPSTPSGPAIERAMVKNTPEQSTDLRNWDEICAWALHVASELTAPVVT